MMNCGLRQCHYGRPGLWKRCDVKPTCLDYSGSTKTNLQEHSWLEQAHMWLKVTAVAWGYVLSVNWDTPARRTVFLQPLLQEHESA